MRPRPHVPSARPRRPAWPAAAVLCLLAVQVVAVTAAGALELVAGGPPGSEADRLAGIIAPPLAQALGEPVEVRSLAGSNGDLAARAVHEAAPDGATLLVADDLRLALNEVAGAQSLPISALAPIAKLTLGVSVALVVPEGSPIDGWPALLERAGAGAPILAVPGRLTPWGVARSMIEGAAGIEFTLRAAENDLAALAEVAAGRAELALATTNRIEAFGATAGVRLRPIVTFGAKRSPRYPTTPTFAELTGDTKNDFTYSFAVFGPPGLAGEKLQQLAAALKTAAADPRAVEQAEALGIALVWNDGEIVRATLARDLGVARAVAQYLERP